MESAGNEAAMKDLTSIHFSDQGIAQIVEKEMGESSSDLDGLEPSPPFHNRWRWSEKTVTSVMIKNKNWKGKIETKIVHMGIVQLVLDCIVSIKNQG